MAESPVEELEGFFSQYKRIHYKKREVILRADDTPTGVFYVYKGYVRLFSVSESGQELTLIIVKPQDLFPIRWVFTGERHTYYFDALTPVEISKAPKDKFLEFVEPKPKILHEILKKTLVRLEGLLERMEYAVFGTAYQKVASILVICSERFGTKEDGGIFIRVPLTHKDVANLIGLTRETTSVELKKLEREKLIYKKGGYFHVKNIEKLKESAQWYTFT